MEEKKKKGRKNYFDHFRIQSLSKFKLPPRFLLKRFFYSSSAKWSRQEEIKIFFFFFEKITGDFLIRFLIPLPNFAIAANRVIYPLRRHLVHRLLSQPWERRRYSRSDVTLVARPVIHCNHLTTVLTAVLTAVISRHGPLSPNMQVHHREVRSIPVTFDCLWGSRGDQLSLATVRKDENNKWN